MIHPSAIIDPGARIGKNVTVGPYSIIGPGVSIGDNTTVKSHVVIQGPALIGENNRFFPFCSIGEDPQDKKYNNDTNSELKIGNNNVFREYCTLNRGTEEGGGKTVVGNDNWIMAYVHIAHDCHIGNNTVFANNTTLAGHVQVDDHVIFGGFTGVHQFCHVGRNCFTAISSVVVKDVPPYLLISGNTASPNGLNREGLRRHGFDSNTVDALKQAYKTVYRRGLTVSQALEELKSLAEQHEEVRIFTDFIAGSRRGIVR